jgi:hypothetical protein
MSRHVSQKALKQLTIRGFEPDLEKRLRDLARRDHLSLNQAALVLLRRGAGLAKEKQPDRVGDSLDHLFGTWTKEEADEFDSFMKDHEQIDPEMWK